jgi:DNA-binding transcriptional LysR family regulator
VSTFDLRRLDLNLVVALSALLEERNISAAARRLSVTQPAASQSLAKLRRHFDDDLLVRVDGRYELTALGATLDPLVRTAIADLSVVLGSTRAFDPAETGREFRVSMSDHVLVLFGGALAGAFAARAPRAGLRFEPLPLPGRLRDSLLQVDALLTPRSIEPPGETVPLFRDEWCLVVDRDRADLARTWTPEEALAQPWVTTEIHGIVPGHEFLRRSGIEFELAVTVPTFSTVPYVVAGTPFVGLVQRRLAEHLADVTGTTVVAAPWPMPAIHLVAFHDRQRALDPAVRWFLDLLVEVCGDDADHDRTASP